MPKLEYRIKNVYGVEKMYPANESAEIIASLAGQKTLTSREIALATQLGFSCQQVM